MMWVALSQFIIGIVLTLSGTLKIIDLKGFRRIVAFYGLIPVWLLTPSAYALPFIEAMVGLALLFNQFTFYASLLAEILLLTAVIFLTIALMKKKKMENCGCFGTYFKIPLSWWEVAEDLVWITLNTIVLISSF